MKTTKRKDPLWSVLQILPTDYAGYGGEVPEAEKAGDCSSGCRWAAYLEESGDWLVCTKPGAPRFGLLTWEHQAGNGCFEWACYRCRESGDKCKCPPEVDIVELPSRCWFCGKGRREINQLITAESSRGGLSCAICNECVGLCRDLLGEEMAPTPSHLLRPEQYAALIAWANEDAHRAPVDWTLGTGAPLPQGTRPETAACLAALAIAQELRDRFAPKAPATTWGWSTDPKPDYWFLLKDGDGFPTREAAIASARADADFDWADELWVTEGRRLPSSVAMTLDSSDAEQAMNDYLADNHGGDCAVGWPDISPAADTVLVELLEQWADRWVSPLPWQAIGKPERVEQPHPHVMPCRPKPCAPCGGVNAAGCEMCGGTGQTCTTHARSWSLCKVKGDKP